MKIDRIGILGSLFDGVELFAKGLASGWEQTPTFLWMAAADAEAVAEKELIDAWVLLHDEGDEPVAVISVHGGPVVARSLAYLPREISVVAMGDEQVGRLAGEYLGARYPGPFTFLGFDQTFSRRRHEGFQEVIGDDVPALLVPRIDMREVAAKLVRGSAVFCATDEVARKLISTLLTLGRRVPAEVAVMGVNNSPLPAGGPGIALTTIELPLEEQGRRAAEALRRQADLKGAGFLQTVEPGAVLARATA